MGYDRPLKNTLPPILDGPRHPTVPEYPAYLKFLSHCYNFSDPRWFGNDTPFFYGTGSHQLKTKWILKAGKRFAANVSVFPFVSIVEGRKLKVAGIGSVATEPDFRGRGYTTRLMEHLNGQLAKEGYDLSILWGFHLYRSFGYEMAMPKEKFFFSARLLKASKPNGVLQPAKPGDWKSMFRLFQKHPQHNQRILAYYDSLYHRYRRDFPKPFWIWKKGEKTLAYAIFGKAWGGNTEVVEWGGEAEGVVDLVKHFLLSGQAKELTVSIPGKHPLGRWAGGECDSWEKTTEGCMVKILNLAGVLKAFEPQLRRRYSQAGVPVRRSFTFQMEGGQAATLALHKGLRVAPNEAKGTIPIFLTRLEAVRLLLGHGRPSEAVRMKGQDAKIFDALFPLEWFWWKSDYI